MNVDFKRLFMSVGVMVLFLVIAMLTNGFSCNV
jgi:TfoX/Sxy family transcriptional regulator of competence genes